MKYYEFNDYPYYALICATTEEEAIKEYYEHVCEFEEGEDEENSRPNEITRGAAMKQVHICCNKKEVKEILRYSRGCEQEAKPYLLLIDGSVYGI